MYSCFLYILVLTTMKNVSFFSECASVLMYHSKIYLVSSSRRSLEKGSYINNMVPYRLALRDNRSGNLSGSCRQGEGAPDNVKHVKRPNSISWKRDTQQDAPHGRDPCPSCFHPCLLSRSGKSWSRRTPWDIFLSVFLFKRATSFRVRRLCKMRIN